MKENNRSSNFELLRIIAMIMIIIHHLFVHCIGVQLTDVDSITRFSNRFFDNPIIYPRLWLADFGAFIGPLANTFFMLISGYFMSEKNNINMIKISTKLLSQLAFAAISLIFASFAWFMITEGKYAGLVDISYFNTLSWYIGYYFLIILIGKLFLNSFLSKLNSRQYLEFLLILFSLIEFRWTGTLLNNVIPGLRLLCTGILLYGVGGYIKKFNPLQKIKTASFILFFFFVIVLICVSAYNIRIISIEDFKKNAGDHYIQTIATFNNWDILAITTGMMIFELFRRIKPFYNKFINFLASATLMIYIVHDNNFFYSLWMKVDWISYWHNNICEFLLNILIWTIITFVIGLFVYIAYTIVYKLFTKNINWSMGINDKTD